MNAGDYEKFQQRVFDEMSDLEHADQQRILTDFVQAGKQYGIDVIAEIVDKNRPASEALP